MLSANTVITIGIVFILILLAVLFLIPAEIVIRENRKKKREQAKQIDWEKEAAHSERHIKSLRQEIESLRKKLEDKERALEDSAAKINKLEEKIGQERGWREKEKGDVGRRENELHSFKKELIKTQETLAKEHATFLKTEKLLQEQKREISDTNDKRRALDAENAQLKNAAEQYQREISSLKAQVAELSKKKEDFAWVAKADYLKLEQQLKEKEKILERLRNETQK